MVKKKLKIKNRDAGLQDVFGHTGPLDTWSYGTPRYMVLCDVHVYMYECRYVCRYLCVYVFAYVFI